MLRFAGIEVASDEIEIGQLLLVKSGEKVPIDGQIVEGCSDIDQSLLTGESMPVKKSEGDEVSFLVQLKSVKNEHNNLNDR